MKLTTPLPSFLKKKHELSALSKQLDKEAQYALSYLAEVAKDIKADPSERIACAKFLVATSVEVQKEINKDTLTRMMAEFKRTDNRYQGGNGQGDEGEDGAVTDFTNIQEIA